MVSTTISGDLAELPENPVPQGMVSGTFATRDGISVRHALLKTRAGKPRGTVIMLHGRNESIEKYFETAVDLAEAGFDTATFDWRGQGGSHRAKWTRYRGHVESFHDYVNDLEDFFVEIALPDCRAPFYILAHSTGALVALLAAPTLANRVDRMVLSAPLLGFHKLPLPPWLLHGICSFLHYFGLGRICMTSRKRRRRPRRFEGNSLTHDKVRFERNAKLFAQFPNLSAGCLTASWMNAAFNAIGQVTGSEFSARVTIPILMIAGGDDTVVSRHAIEEQENRLRSGSMLTIDGARHEILQEDDRYREQLLAAFQAFVPGKSLVAG